ncbi:MAG: hypothetical protein DMF89_23830 [Acidobacteria bacterium]|nr:MAG: hypothetical protein DMF89_23830 [Acidobacteriota bacterium]
MGALTASHQDELGAARRTAEAREREAAQERQTLQKQFDADRTAAQTDLDQSHAESRRLQTVVDKLQAEIAQLKKEIGQLESSRQADRESAARRDQETARARQALESQLEAQKAGLLGELDRVEAERRRLEADMQALQATIRQLETSHVAEWQAAERRGQEASRDYQALQERLNAQQAKARSDFDQLRTELDQARADARRLQTALQESETQHRLLDASSAAERMRLEQHLDALVARHQIELHAAEQAVRKRDQDVASEQQQAVASLEAEYAATRKELAHAVADRLRLDAAIHDLEQRQEQIAASRAEDLSRALQLEQALATERRAIQLLEQEKAATLEAHRAQMALTADSEAERARLARTLADHDVTVQALADQARRLAPLAAAGRVARDVAAQLQDMIQDVDVRTTRILAQCPLDAPTRGDLERLRARAISAGLLTHEVLDAAAELDGTPPSGGRGTTPPRSLR